MTQRLILCVAAFFPDSYGGAERQALILAEALGRQGVDVTVVAPTTWQEAPEVESAQFGRIERFKVQVYPNEGGRHIRETIRWTYWFLDRFGLKGTAVVPIYVFHARLHALGPALAAIRTGAPLLVKLGGGGEASDFAALRAKKFFYGRWVQSLLLRRTDRFVANGAQIVTDLLALGASGDQIAAFPNGVVLPATGEVDRWLARRTGDRFVFTGRMVSDKRVATLHEAAVSLADSQRPARLVFLGDGPERDRLNGLPHTTTQAAAVSFPGFVKDVYAELETADFFMSASLREGQSNSLLEAMSAGVIPIVARASGVEEVVHHGENGFIVDGEAPADFAAVMAHAMTMTSNERHAMARAARAFAANNIGIDAIASRTLQTLADASAHRLGTARS